MDIWKREWVLQFSKAFFLYGNSGKHVLIDGKHQLVNYRIKYELIEWISDQVLIAILIFTSWFIMSIMTEGRFMASHTFYHISRKYKGRSYLKTKHFESKTKDDLSQCKCWLLLIFFFELIGALDLLPFFVTEARSLDSKAPLNLVPQMHV